MEDNLNALALSAGFTAAEAAQLERKLKVFELLVMESRARDWASLCSQLTRSEILACAQLLRRADLVAAAKLLQQHAQSMVLDADAVTLRFISMGLPDPTPSGSTEP